MNLHDMLADLEQRLQLILLAGLEAADLSRLQAHADHFQPLTTIKSLTTRKSVLQPLVARLYLLAAGIQDIKERARTFLDVLAMVRQLLGATAPLGTESAGTEALEEIPSLNFDSEIQKSFRAYVLGGLRNVKLIGVVGSMLKVKCQGPDLRGAECLAEVSSVHGQEERERVSWLASQFPGSRVELEWVAE